MVTYIITKPSNILLADNTVEIDTLPEEVSEFENLNTSIQSEGRPKHGRKQKSLSKNRAIRKTNCIQNKDLFHKEVKFKKQRI